MFGFEKMYFKIFYLSFLKRKYNLEYNLLLLKRLIATSLSSEESQ